MCLVVHFCTKLVCTLYHPQFCFFCCAKRINMAESCVQCTLPTDLAVFCFAYEKCGAILHFLDTTTFVAPHFWHVKTATGLLPSTDYCHLQIASRLLPPPGYCHLQIIATSRYHLQIIATPRMWGGSPDYCHAKNVGGGAGAKYLSDNVPVPVVCFI